MLNDIRLHLDSDEAVQSQIENEIQHTLNKRLDENSHAFKHYIPNIGNAIEQIPFARLSVFVDKQKQTNIVDFNTGNTLYGLSVDESIQYQVNNWAYCSVLLEVPEKEKPIHEQINQADSSPELVNSYARRLQQSLKSQPADTLVSLGLGKATHLAALFSDDNAIVAFDSSQIKNLIIYEQDWEVFRCSLSTFDWKSFLEFAQQIGLRIFMQVGTSIENLFDDICELQEQVSAKRILFYKHINHPFYCHIVSNIKHGYWGRSVHFLQQVGQVSLDLKQANTEAYQSHYLHHFSAIDAKSWQAVSLQNEQFIKNMALFKEYFPDIHEVFKDYKARTWLALSHVKTQQINLLNVQHLSYLSGNNPQEEALVCAQHFANYPNVDGLVFGYEGDKQRHYLHNSFIRQADKRISRHEEEKGKLPQRVKALLVFGLGSGYMLEALAGQHDIENFIICEPNPDFFYASLYAMDWTPIFEHVNNSEHKLYINIGEASSRLFKDLMSQFLILGPHLLNETYIFQAYQNPELNQILIEVRQQLKVIFAMGENFDHVAYGIAHTLRAIHENVPAMRFNPSQYLSRQHKQTPVFLVGNGPSLDDSIEIIKESREQVIVVSCGTALQALYKNGIKPDFHGEVEQNRANFDWASRINDRNYLKQITLLSVNGIHPDTYQLYKDVLFAFKAGESSTHSTLAMFPEKSFECLDNAYPTVTNMALSFFLSLGFEQIYLVGVDLGFADQNKHHSSASGYYENGKQIYDYKSVHSADMRVKGNRQDWVYTKTEFNISRMIIEQLLQHKSAHKKANIECFNLSDGVFINGTISLHPDEVLVVNHSENKQDSLAALNNCFMTTTRNIYDMFELAYKQCMLTEQVEQLIKLTSQPTENIEQIQVLIKDLNTLLREARRTGKSLFFYYFFNSINYLNAALNKATLHHDEIVATQDCQFILEKWQVFLHDAQHLMNNQQALLDSCEAFSDRRERYLLNDKAQILYYALSDKIRGLLQKQNANFSISPIKVIDDIQQALSLNTQALIIDIEKASDLPTIAKRLSECDTSTISSKAIVFHEIGLIHTFAEDYPHIVSDFCLIYISDVFVGEQNSHLIENGLSDTILAKDYFHMLSARVHDASVFSFMLIKPRFCKTGLKNAKQVIHDAQPKQNEYLQALGIKNDAADESALIKASEDEYRSIAAEIIQAKFLNQLDIDSAYMFKHYVGVLRASSTDVNKLAITTTDSLENRGLLMSRKPYAFELLGQWYSNDELMGESAK